MAKKGLEDLSVVVTRPAEQAGELAALISQAGGRPVLFPTIEIGPLPFTTTLAEKLHRLDKRADWVIFISTYAVRHGVHCARLAGSRLEETRIASIGGATSRALVHAGLTVALESPPPAGSESLLSTPEMGSVAGKTLFIIRGTGGRELLGDTLRERGAKVVYVECYERRCPEGPVDAVVDALDSASGGVIVTTSVNGLENLMAMAKRCCQRRILHAPLLVAGARQAREAMRLGWGGEVAVAKDAGNEAVVGKLREFAAAIAGRR